MLPLPPLLLPPLPTTPDYDGQQSSIREQAQRTREKLREQLREGRLDHKQVEIEVREKSFPSFEIIAGSNVEEVDINMKDMLPGLFAGRTRKRKLRVPEALEALAQEEEQKLIDMETVARAAVERHLPLSFHRDHQRHFIINLSIVPLNLTRISRQPAPPSPLFLAFYRFFLQVVLADARRDRRHLLNAVQT